MKRYKYKAKDQEGKVITGEVEATNDKQAARLLRQKNLTIITKTPKKEIPFNLIKKYKERVTQGDITNFTRQLATMVNAGLPLTEAILILRNQLKGKMLSIISEILSDVEEGNRLSVSMETTTKFSSMVVLA